MRILIILALALLSGHAAAVEIISGPYVRTCNGNVHAWVYTQSASGVYAPGPSCPASAACLSPAAIGAKAIELMSAPDPAQAASAALASSLAFECTQLVTAAATWRGDLCRERRQFTQANLKTATGIDPFGGPTQEPSCAAPVYTYHVRPNGTAPDRPVSTLVNGVRGLISGPRAAVGQPCDTTRPTLPSTGTDLWASYGPDFPSIDGKQLVALCSK